MAEVPINHDNHLLLEHAFLKVPYELSRKTFKTSQRYVERERDQLLSSLKSSGSEISAATDSAAVATSTLDSMIQRMDTLKRKLNALHTEEATTHQHTRARIANLQALHDITSLSSPAYAAWNKTRLDRLIVDYLLRIDCLESAQALAKAANIEPLVDIQAYSDCYKIEDALRQGKLSEALAWCAENRAGLKKLAIPVELETELRLQQYIEMLRKLGTEDAVKPNAEALATAAAHARKYLTTAATPTHSHSHSHSHARSLSNSNPTTTTVTLIPADIPVSPHADIPISLLSAGLLAFPPTTPIEPYATLYSPARYAYLASYFLGAHRTLLALPPSPALHISLAAGLSALKTPACHSVKAATGGSTGGVQGGSGVCPICSTELNEVSRCVPWSLRTISQVEAEPVVLPNGRLYGIERLRRLNDRVGSASAGGGRGVDGTAGAAAGRGATGSLSGGRVVFTGGTNTNARRAPDIEMAYAAGYTEEDEAGDDDDDDDDRFDDDDDNDIQDDDNRDARQEEADAAQRAVAYQRHIALHGYEYDSLDGDGDGDDDDDGMSLDGNGVGREEEGVPGGRGRLRDPMPPREWFEWRDVRKVFIM